MFEDEVKNYQHKNLCSLACAVKAVSKDKPQLHDDYVTRLKNGRATSLLKSMQFKGTGPETFEGLVDMAIRTKGISVAEAVRLVQKNFPESHADYFLRIRAGKAAPINKRI